MTALSSVLAPSRQSPHFLLPPIFLQQQTATQMHHCFTHMNTCFLFWINYLASGQDYFHMEQDCYHLIENNYPMQIAPFVKSRKQQASERILAYCLADC